MSYTAAEAAAAVELQLKSFLVLKKKKIQKQLTIQLSKKYPSIHPSTVSLSALKCNRTEKESTQTSRRILVWKKIDFYHEK